MNKQTKTAVAVQTQGEVVNDFLQRAKNVKVQVDVVRSVVALKRLWENKKLADDNFKEYIKEHKIDKDVLKQAKEASWDEIDILSKLIKADA